MFERIKQAANSPEKTAKQLIATKLMD